ncbi:unnamed protein product [Porites lobata]|uniref:VWFA domain-containing protein n=1 Tax=Porites lobata TaxID=104759 RepID=A0ABN8N6Q5_9CNID|nr:unnamed protein product [Porites lobata]
MHFLFLLVCPFAVDLAFLLDASGSIGPDNYKQVKAFIIKLIEYFPVSSAGTHVGVVSFSSSAKTEIMFSAKQNVKAIKASILNITYYAGSTQIDLGLEECRTKLFAAGGGMRSNVPQVLLVITDGRSTGGHAASKRESQLLNNKGIVVFALGLGSLVNSAEINALASEPNHVFHYLSFRQMLPTDNGLRIALALCSVGRTSNAFVHPVVTHRSLKSHTLASRSAHDDFECALFCISHSSCYSFNFHSPSRYCELSYARRNLAAGDFVVDRDFVYSELQFE